MSKTLRFLCILLAVMGIFAVTGSFAESGYSANWGYAVNEDGTLTLNSYYGHESMSTKERIVQVPSHIAGVPVTGIELCIRTNEVTQIILPDTLRFIGDEAFTGVKNLEEIQLPEGLEYIGARAFKGLKKLKHITMPSTVAAVGANAFEGCAALPETLAFEYEEAATEPEWTQVAQDKIVYRLYADHAAAWGAEEKGKLKGKVTIPAEVNGLPVTRIGGFANENKLTQMTLPEGLTEICDEAFIGCKKLKTVILPTTLKRIGDRAFKDSAIAQLTLPEGLEEIGTRAFEYCKKLSKLPLPESLWKIGDGAFGASGLTAIAFPQQMKHLPYGVCSQCTKLKKAELPAGLLTVGRFAFGQSSSLKSVTLPEGLKIIGHNAFQSTGISKLTIPESVEEIGRGAFAGKKLKQVTIYTRTNKIIMSAFPQTLKNGYCWKGSTAERILKAQKVKVKYLK